MDEIIIEFEDLFYKEIQPYLEKNGFTQTRKKYDPSIKSYKLVFSLDQDSNTRHISFEFCLHHYDLYDGIFVFLYTDKETNDGYGRLSLNEVVKKENETRKIYSPLVLKNTIPTILKDLEKISDFFISKIDPLKYQDLYNFIKKKSNNAS